jgi:hypothetical protein
MSEEWTESRIRRSEVIRTVNNLRTYCNVLLRELEDENHFPREDDSIARPIVGYAIQMVYQLGQLYQTRKDAK